ncbi:hypothetical protein AC579_5200 [Pseudocercospora musae]|uniref:Uncharacterized protein n=1 Tax=Pseudocercospora musae TaxID=113226 RepID=A0A139IAW5_9PEZI|nr:hypothetical protein AC579_5200 [Pseudocercospora musae]
MDNGLKRHARQGTTSADNEPKTDSHSQPSGNLMFFDVYCVAQTMEADNTSSSSSFRIRDSLVHKAGVDDPF